MTRNPNCLGRLRPSQPAANVNSHTDVIIRPGASGRIRRIHPSKPYDL